MAEHIHKRSLLVAHRGKSSQKVARQVPIVSIHKRLHLTINATSQNISSAINDSISSQYNCVVYLISGI